ERNSSFHVRHLATLKESPYICVEQGRPTSVWNKVALHLCGTKSPYVCVKGSPYVCVKGSPYVCVKGCPTSDVSALRVMLSLQHRVQQHGDDDDAADDNLLEKR